MIAKSLDSRFESLQFVDMHIEDFMKNSSQETKTETENVVHIVNDCDSFDENIKYLDVLVALHACDVATDDAIYYGIRNNADIILTSPCCHKQIRKQIDVFHAMSKNDKEKSENVDGTFSLLEYGIFRERQSEMITDQIRAILLSLAGYDTNISEFIASEHTAKNIM